MTDSDQSSDKGVSVLATGGNYSLEEIAHLTGLDIKIVRRMLRRGILSKDRESVDSYLKHQNDYNILARQPRVRHDRVFSKWRD